MQYRKIQPRNGFYDFQKQEEKNVKTNTYIHNHSQATKKNENTLRSTYKIKTATQFPTLKIQKTKKNKFKGKAMKILFTFFACLLGAFYG